MRLPLPTVSSDRFTFNKDTNTFFAFASDLMGVNLFSRIYDDACDEGFALVSVATGVVATFYFAGTKTYNAGDDSAIDEWLFKPMGPFNGVLFGLRDTKLVIAND